MNEQKFSTRQAVSVSTMFLIGQMLIMYNGNPAKTDVWMSLILAYVTILPMMLVYARLMNVFPGKNLFDLMPELFGPCIGGALTLLYTLFYLHVSSLVLRDMTNFIQVTSLIRTPQFIPAVLIGVLCIYGVKSGINSIGRYAAMALPVYLLILVTQAVLTMTLWSDPTHLGTPLYNGVKPMLKSAINLAAFPFSDAAVLPFVLQPLKKHRKARAIFLSSYTICSAVFAMVGLQDLLVLGDNFTFTLYFPTYITISLIDIADFLQRIEVAMGAIMFMGVFIKISVYLYVFSLGLSKLLRMADYRKFAAPAGMLMVVLSQFAYPNMLVNIAFATNIYPYYALIMNVTIPLVIWLAAEWRRKRLIKEGRLPDPPPAGEETPVARQDGGAPQNPDGSPGKQPQPT